MYLNKYDCINNVDRSTMLSLIYYRTFLYNVGYNIEKINYIVHFYLVEILQESHKGHVI